MTQERLTEEEMSLIHVHGGLIEMGPKKKPKKTAFILFRKETINLRGIGKRKKLRFGCLIS